MLVWLQAKHYVADYLLQPVWMLDPRAIRVGPAAMPMPASMPSGRCQPSWLQEWAPKQRPYLVLAEFAAHYLIDFGKARLSDGIHGGPDTKSTGRFTAATS